MAPIRKTEAAQPRDRQTEALLEFRNRRLQRRLEDLERTNPTDIPATSFVPQPVLSQTGVPVQKKKQTGNVRKVLGSKKGLKDWLDELPKTPIPPYTLAPSPAPLKPARKICSSCGYIGSAYACERCGEYSCDMVCLDVHKRDGGCGVGR